MILRGAGLLTRGIWSVMDKSSDRRLARIVGRCEKRIARLKSILYLASVGAIFYTPIPGSGTSSLGTTPERSHRQSRCWSEPSPNERIETIPN